MLPDYEAMLEKIYRVVLRPGDVAVDFESLGYGIYSIFGIPQLRDQFISATEDQSFWDYIAIPSDISWFVGHAHIEDILEQLKLSSSRVTRDTPFSALSNRLSSFFK